MIEGLNKVASIEGDKPKSLSNYYAYGAQNEGYNEG